MSRGLVFLDIGETADGFAEDVVGLVVVDGRDLADQDIAASPQKACQSPGMSVTLSPGASFSFWPGP